MATAESLTSGVGWSHPWSRLPNHSAGTTSTRPRALSLPCKRTLIIASRAPPDVQFLAPHACVEPLHIRQFTAFHRHSFIDDGSLLDRDVLRANRQARNPSTLTGTGGCF